MRKATAVLILVAACGGGDSTDTTTAAALSDAETVWCEQHWGAVLNAANALGIDLAVPRDEFDLPPLNNPGDLAPDTTNAIATALIEHWQTQPSYDDDYLRSCRAAFEGR